jgi:TolB-like protein
VAVVLIALFWVWWGWTQAVAPPGPIRSLAVLPLENLSGDPEQEYFADGMTDALISDLAKIGSLRVISRTSIMQYKGERKPLPEIARELDVEAVIEGTVMRAGDQVRITVQLIDARNDAHLWANRYDRDLSGILALQSDVARTVAEQVRVKLTTEEQAVLGAPARVDPHAYDAYLRGLELTVSASLLEAIEYLERAVELAPEFAEGHADLAWARMRLGTAFLRPAEERRGALPGAVEAAKRALELDDRLGRAHGVIGLARTFQWDFAEAGRALGRGAELSPNDPGVLGAYTWYLLMVGRVDEALHVSERLRRVAPLDTQHLETYANSFFWARRYERAIEEYERLLQIDPTAQSFFINQSYYQAGRVAEAHRARLGLWRSYSQFLPLYVDLLEAYEDGWTEGGWEGGHRAQVRVAAEAAAQGRYSPFSVGATYAQLGEIDEAFAWLDRAYRVHDPGLTGVKTHPWLDPLRSDPRFDDLLRRIGFPES